MKRYFVELSYNGSNYCGWQRQINALGVEQVVEESLSKIIGCQIDVVGCGRTDTGVHAKFCVAHFDVENHEVEEKKIDKIFIYHLNAILPKDIAVLRIYRSDKHARFDAKKREYKYFLSAQKEVFNQNVWQLRGELNFDQMQLAANILLEFDDFTSFAKVGSDNKTNICKIFKAQFEVSGKEAIFTIEADRFLRGMVRGIIGTLVEVGRGKISVERFREIIMAKDRGCASSQAPSQGLFLTKVEY